ncbi:hypothetical protein F4775DRAFT_606269 [Biscogniauxia sp. FL1348]|nr:hypothetical protein F4775DRAFT_606269 [Biscogniauxia sp. FL1348]
MPDMLEYTGRNGFLSLRLHKQAKTEAMQLAERRREYQRLYLKCVEGSATGQRTWGARRAEYVGRMGLAEGELAERVLRRYGGEEHEDAGPDPALLVEKVAADSGVSGSGGDGDDDFEELEIEITAVDREIMEQHGMTEEEYVENLLDMAEELTPSGKSLRVKVKKSLEDGGEKQGGAEDEEEDDEDDDEEGGAPTRVPAEGEPAPELEQGEAEGELYDIDGFLEEKMKDLDLFEFPALNARDAAWWQKEAAYVCRRLVRAIDAELDVPLRILDVRTWLGVKKARKSKSRSKSRSKSKPLGTTY